MEKGNVNVTLLTNNISYGIFTKGDNTLQFLHEKHSTSKNAYDEVLMSGGKPCLDLVIYESINEDLVKGEALKMRGGLGASGLDTDGWTRILASNSYGTVNIDLGNTFVEVIKEICIKNIE